MTHSSTFDESTLVEKHKKRTFTLIREELFVPACDHALHLADITRQPRPQGFSRKKIEGKALGTRLITRSHERVAKGRTYEGKGLSSHSNRPEHKKSHVG